MQKKLEIIIVTYNRKEHLQNTFNQIFADNSPIKNLPITILDNKSTDGTSDLIQEYVKKFPNIKHVIHNRNIGGNANITRAFEIAKAKYVWILCDDDEYNWQNWAEVEDAMAKDYDAIVVANYVNPKKNLACLVKQLTFVPAAIYKTENITATTMVNAEFNLSNMFAQLALPCHLINTDKTFYICDGWSVKMVPQCNEESYTRGLDNEAHPLMKNMHWFVGFVNSAQMIFDKKKRKHVINNVNFGGKTTIADYWIFFSTNQKWGGNSLKNILDVFAGIDFLHKILYAIILFIFSIMAATIRSQYMDEKMRFIVCSKLKVDIRIRPKRHN